MTIFTMFSNSVQVSRLRDSTNLRRDLLERHCDHGQHIFCQYHLQNVSGGGKRLSDFSSSPHLNYSVWCHVVSIAVWQLGFFNFDIATLMNAKYNILMMCLLYLHILLVESENFKLMSAIFDFWYDF